MLLLPDDSAMTFFLKLTAYAFLALMGISAWRSGVEGWRYYFGICLFIVCTLRILTILRQRMTKKNARSAAAAPLPGSDTSNGAP
jgi:TRAP-type C4-dicarboxylate transport system permease small subunit